MTSKFGILRLLLILSSLIVIGCTGIPSGGPIGMPNPASVHCTEQGYTYEIRTAADGGQHGVCIFPDGSECEEWAFYRGECSPGAIGMPNPASVHCEEQGYTLELRTATDGSQYGVCIFPDGSECEEWAYFRGECGPGSEEGGATPEIPILDPARARDVALDYLTEHYGEQAPAPGLSWTEEIATPEKLVGASTFQYTADDWLITVSFPIVAPGDTIYQVAITNEVTGFQWEGEVDAAGQVTEKPAPSAGDFQPLSPTACRDLAEAMAQTLGVEVATAEAPFQDYISGTAGAGCQATATGTGLDFESYVVVADALRGMLTEQGWSEDVMYAADSPAGTASGLRQDDSLCLLNVGWKPSEDANCPDNQPIATCDLPPEQKLYTIVLNCAQKTGTEAWKTYTSEKFGYTLQYPSDAKVMGADPDTSVQFVGPVIDNEHWPWFTVNHPDTDFYHPPVGTDVHQWIADSEVSYDEMGPDVEIAGLPAVHLIYKRSPQAYASDQYYFIKGGQLFNITILHAGDKQDWDVYDRFLRSVTFP